MICMIRQLWLCDTIYVCSYNRFKGEMEPFIRGHYSSSNAFISHNSDNKDREKKLGIFKVKRGTQR